MSVRLNPKTAFSILPKKGWTLTPKRSTEETGNTSVYRVKGKNKWQIGPRRPPARTPKKGAAAVLQKYYDEGGQRVIQHVYARNYTRFVGTSHLLAVKTDKGERGWVTTEGRFIGEDAFRNLLHSIDMTTVGGGLDLTGLGDPDRLAASQPSLVELWDSLRPSQKAAVVDALRDYDWDQFWVEYYPRARLKPKKGGGFTRQRLPGSYPQETENQISMLDEIVLKIAEALGK